MAYIFYTEKKPLLMLNFFYNFQKYSLPVAALFLYFENINAQASYAHNLSSKIIGDDKVTATPASDKIVFSKMIKNGNRVFNVHLYAFGSLLDAGKGVRIILINGKEIKNPDAPVEIGIPNSHKVAFKYSGTLMLSGLHVEYLKNYPVKEYQIGNFHYVLSKKEQSMFLNYFKYLLKQPNSENLTDGQAQSW